MKNYSQAIITIDGPSASGKTALCRRMAEKMDSWDWLSTGVFYRGLASIALDFNLTREDQWLEIVDGGEWKVQKGRKQTSFFYKGKNLDSLIYNASVDKKASELARSTLIRKALIPYQRAEKEDFRGLVAEGRDCGTAIFPKALLKIYLTAQDEVRAKRRAEERKEEMDSVIQAQKQRDKLDSERTFNPLKKAEGAWTIFSDSYSLDEIEDMVYQKALSYFY